MEYVPCDMMVETNHYCTFQVLLTYVYIYTRVLMFIMILLSQALSVLQEADHDMQKALDVIRTRGLPEGLLIA